MQTQKGTDAKDADSQSRDDGVTCWLKNANAQCLRVELADGTQLLLPYGYFEGATFKSELKNETLQLRFRGQEVQICGQCLSELLYALQKFAVEWVRPLPKRFELVAVRVVIRSITMIEQTDDFHHRGEQQTARPL